MSGEKWKIQTGDVIELIPGHHFFKYVFARTNSEEKAPTTNREKRSLNEESSKGDACSRKRIHKVSDEESVIRNSNVLRCFRLLLNFPGSYRFLK